MCSTFGTFPRHDIEMMGGDTWDAPIFSGSYRSGRPLRLRRHERGKTIVYRKGVKDLAGL